MGVELHKLEITECSYDVLDHELPVDLKELMAIVAHHYLFRAMCHTRGNRTKAAELLGIGTYQNVTNWCKRYDVPIETGKKGS